ncbi:MAG: hypothetical protein J5797_00890 [Prevotella sp.]|nr:hypothetical protein [Prevotella sp.]
MKKEYIIPTIQVVMLSQLQPLAGSGPGAGDQSDPNMSRFMEDDDLDILGISLP